MNYEKEIAKKLLEIKAVTLKNTSDLFTWASGIKAPIYCDNRLTMSYPEVRSNISKGFIELIDREFKGVEVIAGTATAGIPHAAWLSQNLSLPMAYVRSSSKGHGKKNLIEGKLDKGQKVIVIEDLLSTGGSSLKAVEAIKEAGGEVLGVLAIFSYNFKSLKDSFAKENIVYKTLTDYDALLTVANEMGYIEASELELLKKWSNDPYIFTQNNN